MPGRPRMRGYVLAGGRSSRMGRDKAEILFEGRAMLDIAVASMRSVCDDVTIVGVRERGPADVPCIPDSFPGCGPMGGIQAALRDCEEEAAEFAVFLPVDMPLLPGGLLRALTAWWSASQPVHIAMAVADGRLQPLVSMIHVAVSSTIEAALLRGEHKLQPTLHAAAQSLAQKLNATVESVFLTTGLAFGDRVVLTSSDDRLSWSPTETEWKRRRLWFANLNTQADLLNALSYEEETVLPAVGKHLIEDARE